MFEIDELIDNQWKYVYESESILKIDKIAFQLTQIKVPCRVLMDNNLLVFLDGSRYEYDYWKNNYVRKPKTLERKRKDITYTKKCI